MYGITSSAPEVRALQDELSGTVTIAGDAGWDEARAAWNLAVDQRPAVVTEPETVADVVAIMRFARERGLRVTAQGTGHGASALGSLHDTVLVKTHRMRVVGIDPECRLARAQAGAVWADIVAPASEHGLAPLSGSSHDVGVVGYTLGGGLSWLARKHGLASNGVVAIQVVTADGRVRVVGPDHEPDLFWALRGGGGSFGIVTALEIELHPVDELCAGMLAFPWERSAEVLRAWREWTRTVPDEMTSCARIIQIPPLPDIPEPLRGRSLVAIEVACLHGEAAVADLVAPLRDLGPEIDTIAPTGPAGLLGLHMDPPGPVPGAGDGALLDVLPGEAIDALVAAAGPNSGSPLLSVELRHLGGAVGRTPDGHGALASIEADFALYAVGMAPDAAAAATVNAHIDVLKGAVSEWNCGRRFLNFSERADGHDAWTPEALRRLRAVKTLVDPDDMIRANHPIAPIG
jgi:FAD binding domain-containing protein